ncbi:MAG TPA: alanine--tRNA ligase [Geminicoccus sp.]|jgi:alanyl-tRNA synthetase|uniref:alanine--tRNA ligase n=1 Tax=Geminicoccus sp. TaxID=2024832 RepID=UPI002E374E2E|nr:alanine--tRNA ligase [Geminicoccus sp.]HEX2529802.1 alanine--tRNA ligase [Geminicoccus sp.]
MASVSEIRTKFLEYFGRHGHEIVASGPLVPHNDPTLLFTNAGMVQFKNVFTGLEHRSYNRATTAQKCVRAGGKHNDLDNVGYTARHHTFFEMLGNFSFGDYFKEQAIELAWNLVTREYGLPKDKLTATVYAEDDEAFGLWTKIAGLPESRIIRIPTSDNFWAMGDTGPCGPCSEIFYDHGDKVPGGPPGSPDADGDRFIEIWNLVFMQFEQVDKSTRVNLPRPSIDTGMGLERLAAVLQGKHDNFEIDLFARIIAKSEELTGTPAEGPSRPSHKVIADHLRASSFLIADGVMPSNEGRGYVLRRIMRRGMRHAQLLGAREPLLFRMVPTLIEEMGKAYPELVRAEALVTEVLKLEETNFRRTLERGLRLLDEEVVSLPQGQPLSGEVAFKLYDTYGFPLDLTQDALRSQGRSVDLDGFDAAMERQRAEARKHWKGSGSSAIAPIWFDLRERAGATEFLGYATATAEAKVVGLVVDDALVEEAGPGTEVRLVANQTPFYGESGGQIGDTGTITSGDATIAVSDTQKYLGDLFVHIGKVESGTIRVGDDIRLAIDVERRARIRRAHSATHLMHKALQRHLGRHVAQKGSRVEPDRLRFDFSHPKPVSKEEIAAVEREVNSYLRQNDPTTIRIMAKDDAIETGAMALFGEKYGDEVRVVSMGTADDGKTYSVELCGGTHVARTGDIALFKLLAEGAVAAGVRRIEAVTGELALSHVEEEEAILAKAAGALKVPASELPGRIEALVEERRKLERELADLRRKIATGGLASENAARQVNGISFAARQLEGVPAKELRGTADELKKQLGSGVVTLVSVTDGKASVVVSTTDDLTGRVDSVALVRRAVEALGGQGGGGRRDFAQGGGPDAARAAEAIAVVEATLATM